MHSLCPEQDSCLGVDERRKPLPLIVDCFFKQTDVVNVSTSGNQSQGEAIGIGHQRTFVALFASIGRIISGGLAAQRRLGYRPFNTLPSLFRWNVLSQYSLQGSQVIQRSIRMKRTLKQRMVMWLVFLSSRGTSGDNHRDAGKRYAELGAVGFGEGNAGSEGGQARDNLVQPERLFGWRALFTSFDLRSTKWAPSQPVTCYL